MVTGTSLDDVDFLARSAHRVEVLRTLVSGPRTRADLHDETGISQPTLGRIFGAFEDRHWVERKGRYALTLFGELVCEEFEGLLDTVETVQKFGDVVQKLPTERMDFDLRQFRDATITTPEGGDAFCHIRRMEEILYGADHVRNLAPTVAPRTPEDYQNRWEEFFDGNQQIEAIISAEILQG